MDQASSAAGASERYSDAPALKFSDHEAASAAPWARAFQAMRFQMVLPRLLSGPVPVALTLIVLMLAFLLQ